MGPASETREVALQGERWHRTFRPVELAGRSRTGTPRSRVVCALHYGRFWGYRGTSGGAPCQSVRGQARSRGSRADVAANGVMSRCTALGGEVLALAADISQPRDAQRVVDETRAGEIRTHRRCLPCCPAFSTTGSFSCAPTNHAPRYWGPEGRAPAPSTRRSARRVRGTLSALLVNQCRGGPAGTNRLCGGIRVPRRVCGGAP